MINTMAMGIFRERLLKGADYPVLVCLYVHLFLLTSHWDRPALTHSGPESRAWPRLPGGD